MGQEGTWDERMCVMREGWDERVCGTRGYVGERVCGMRGCGMTGCVG